MSTPVRPPRGGFTLVELLVVVLIIAMLMGLLTPAIIAARERARQSQCADHQRNLGQAIIQFELAKGYFPGHVNQIAWQVPSPADASLTAGVGWPVMILQHIDRVDLWDALRTAKDADDVAQVQQQVAVFLCPSAEPTVEAPLSYVANCGQQDWGADGLGTSQNPPDWPANGIFFRHYNDVNDKGIKVVKIKVEDIKDGTRHTLLISENLQAGQWLGQEEEPLTKELAQGMLWWPDRDKLEEEKEKNEKAKVVIAVNGDRDEALVEEVDPKFYARPSSYHPGGVIATFCDGHSQFINEQIDYLVYQLLMTPDGANALVAGNDVAPSPVPDWRTTPLKEGDLD